MSPVKITLSLDLNIEQRRALEKELGGGLMSNDRANQWAEAVVGEALSEIVWWKIRKPEKDAGMRYIEGAAR